MNKTAICIRMLQILNTGRIYKVDELVALLNEDSSITTNRRNVLEYKKELEACGFPIESIPGPYGGYRLSKTETMPMTHLNSSEEHALYQSLSYINSYGDFPDKHFSVSAVSKVFSSISMHAVTADYLYGERQRKDSVETVSPVFLTLQSAIEKKDASPSIIWDVIVLSETRRRNPILYFRKMDCGCCSAMIKRTGNINITSLNGFQI